MKVLLKVLIVLVIAAFAIADSHKCGLTHVFECNVGETCCEGPTGYICDKREDAKCCEDKLTICDKVKKCDNEKHVCVDDKLAFLSYE
jgi:hypothetical protein